MPNVIGLFIFQLPLGGHHHPRLFFCAAGFVCHLDEHKDLLYSRSQNSSFFYVGEILCFNKLVISFFFSSPLQIPGKKNKLRVYYLSWLRNKILRNDPEVEKRQGWVSVGDLEGCVHYKVGKALFFP